MSHDADLPCPECWLDPEIVPLIRLLTRLGISTVFSCAGFGISRNGVEPPLARLPPFRRKLVKNAGHNYYLEDLRCHEEHGMWPYVVLKVDAVTPEWVTGVISYLRKSKGGNCDLRAPADVEALPNVHIFRVDPKSAGSRWIGVSPEFMRIAEKCSKPSILYMKKAWIHEMIKAFSFMG